MQRYEFFFYLCAVKENYMEQITLKKNIWHAAGTAGLALGAVSSIYLFTGQFLAGDLSPASLWQQVFGMALWAIKFIACIWLMKFFMTKFARENKSAGRKDIFRMGRATALLSALMFSAIYLANMLYISADFYNEIFQETIRQVQSSLDANSLSMLEKIVGKLPQITFTYYLIYCFIFGTVLSAIISRTIPLQEHSSENQQDEQ